MQTSPYVEARIWDGSPDEEEAEFRSWAWRPPHDPPHMPRPPANTAIALMLAHLRSMGELYGQS